MHEFARQLRTRYFRADSLINNAGINRSQQEKSVGGIAFTFTTNVLGYYLLTQDLLSILRVSAPACIVNVAFTIASDFDLTDLQFDDHTYER